MLSPRPPTYRFLNSYLEVDKPVKDGRAKSYPSSPFLEGMCYRRCCSHLISNQRFGYNGGKERVLVSSVRKSFFSRQRYGGEKGKKEAVNISI